MPGPDSTSGKPGPEFTGGVPGPAQPSIVARMFRQLADPLILLLLASAVVTAVLRDVPETVVIVLVVVVNTAIGVAHGVRAATPLQRQLARLGRFLGISVMALAAVVSLSGVVRAEPWTDVVITVVSLVVVAVPEALPAVLATAAREGRPVYDNIRRFLWYGLSGGFAEIVVVLVGPFLGLVVPLLPAQILWINLLTRGLPGIALGVEPAPAVRAGSAEAAAEPGTMRQLPRPPGQSVLSAGLWRSVLFAGLLLTAVVLATGAAAYRAGMPWQSMVFTVLGLGQLSLALAVRARRTRGTASIRWLPVAVALSAVLQVAGVYVPALRLLLGTEPLTLPQLGTCVLGGSLPGLVVAARGHLNRGGATVS